MLGTSTRSGCRGGCGRASWRPPSDLVDQVHVPGALSGARTGKGSQMANPHPTPKLENIRPPWPPGTSGNPAGYSRGRRISDAIERQIDEMAPDREFGATAIAMALGKKYMLKHKVKDPETGEDIWVEHKETVARLPGPIRDLAREIPGEHGSGPRAMTFDLPPVRLVADFRASAMGIKPKSPGSVATFST